MLMQVTKAWRNFSGAVWQRQIDVRRFHRLQRDAVHRRPRIPRKAHRADARRLGKLQPYFREEAKKGVLDVDVATPSSLTSHGPGYIDRDNEVIVGLQTDKPFRRAIMPTGGWGMIENGLKAIGREPDSAVRETLPSIARRITRPSSTCTHRRSAPAGARTSSRGCRTPTGADASSAIIGASRCTASTA
jgi:pyruvate-formate lyase